ncbi:hypothetical protein [Brevundimonas sp. GCM10030266]|uniref:hypothetical protein n=1 Tax=Brevundimonas sp. GCM10030266 TaxID=3273386 RepID=UPI0036190138
MRRTRGLRTSLCLLLAVATAGFTAPPQAEPEAQRHSLQLDPAVLVSVAQVWAVIGSDDNPVWPGWNAAETPVLVYFPGEQELLFNHPDPPEGFVPPGDLVPLARAPLERAWVRNGVTHFPSDGQNTRTEINGVSTLVLADTLSNRRSWIRGLLGAPGTPAERGERLTLARLSGDPYSQMAMVAHEAFHVFQHARAPHKAVPETALLTYPTLSVDNNVGVALEGQALARALNAGSPAEAVRAAREAIALRHWRRRQLTPDQIAYEDGTEFTEGLAKFAEYRLTSALEGRTPIPEMRWVRGFQGFDGMAAVRAALIQDLLDTTDGTRVVNNDAHGAAPVRFRLYSSGMAMAATLDRLEAPGWRDRILQDGTTLTGLLAEHLGVFDEAGVLAPVLATEEAARQRARAEQLAETGEQANAALLASIFTAAPDGPSWRLVLDYSALGPEVEPGFGYTPFGTTAIAPDRIIYRQVLISGELAGAGRFRQQRATPLLHDRTARTVTFRIEGAAPTLTGPMATPRALDGLALPGVDFAFRYGRVETEGGVVTVRLLKAPGGSGGAGTGP